MSYKLKERFGAVFNVRNDIPYDNSKLFRCFKTAQIRADLDHCPFLPSVTNVPAAKAALGKMSCEGPKCENFQDDK